MAMLQRRGLSSTQQSWPGTRAKVCVLDSSSNQHSILELKIITTRVCGHRNIQDGDENDVNFVGGALVFPSGGKSALEVVELQLLGKKVVSAATFWNGLRGRKLKKLQ